jgi:uncharacterized protein YcbX
MRLGFVNELWRYPIKSMRGERVEHTTVAARFGVAGDRGWAVNDEVVGEIRSAKRLADLLQCAVDTGAATPDDFPEFGWVGQHVRIGEVLIRVLRPMQRCVMTVHAQGDLRRDRTILRTLIRETAQNLGVGAAVVNGGTISVGDQIELL